MGTSPFSYTLGGVFRRHLHLVRDAKRPHMLDPSDQIQASSFGIMSGLMTEPTADTLGGYNLGYAENNDYAVYREVDFIGFRPM